MAGGIERFSDGGNGLDAEFSQGAVQLLKRQVDAFHESVTALAVYGCLDSPLQVVDNRQKLFQQLLVAESDLVSLIALGQPFIVIELGRQPQILVVERLQF